MMPEHRYKVTFKNGVTLEVSAHSPEQAKQRARDKYKNDWHRAFGNQAADVGVSGVKKT